MPILFIQVSCKTNDSQLKHDLDLESTTRSPHHYEKDYDDLIYKKAISKSRGIDEIKILSDSHPLTVRLQYWVQKIATVAHRINPSQLQKILTPKVKVIKTNSKSIFVFGKLVCSEKSRLIINPDIDSPMEVKSLLNKKKLEDCAFEKPHIDHFKFSLGKAMFYENRHTVKCGEIRLEEKEGILTGYVNCQGIEKMAVNNLHYERAQPFITVSSGFLDENISEEDIIAILAHELGHYYMDHVNQEIDWYRYNYFFRIDKHNDSNAPKLTKLSKEENKSVDEYLNAYKSHVKRQIVLTKNKLKIKEERVVNLGLGQYTTEEEADHISAELLNSLGINPEILSSVFKKRFRPGYCEMRLEERKKYISSIRDPHHDKCYRAFSVIEDIKRHEYSPPSEGYLKARKILVKDLEQNSPTFEVLVNSIKNSESN